MILDLIFWIPIRLFSGLVDMLPAGDPLNLPAPGTGLFTSLAKVNSVIPIVEAMIVALVVLALIGPWILWRIVALAFNAIWP